jgi:hypothetical protein
MAPLARPKPRLIHQRLLNGRPLWLWPSEMGLHYCIGLTLSHWKLADSSRYYRLAKLEVPLWLILAKK